MADRPRVTVHASISVDGCMTGFAPDLRAHYAAASQIPAQARLIGSATMATGLDESASEALGRAQRRPDDPAKPYWVVVDSTGRMHGRLDAVRAFPPVRDVLVLTSEATPDSFLQYLADNDYRYLMTGRSHVDLAAALALLWAHWQVSDVLVDSGPTLTSVLLSRGLVDEISLLVHPVIVGSAGRHLFDEASPATHLVMEESEAVGGLVRMRYRVRQAAAST